MRCSNNVKQKRQQGNKVRKMRRRDDVLLLRCERHAKKTSNMCDLDEGSGDEILHVRSAEDVGA